jgi:hypothetical protein
MTANLILWTPWIASTIIHKYQHMYIIEIKSYISLCICWCIWINMIQVLKLSTQQDAWQHSSVTHSN